ncbi:Transposase [Saccharothrix espanaensis DSM 44229]|uniref:Transposase n=1 Tax=Saccharothrix espanaensis (strain ATCC 51144 / DSM 44229 / JCM 9112 / NBRC 15066 / NRRL 15764) TaxID=1179773 RepID=K0JUY4_SACES|nr:Transposase [Saccharothrix espanaensis DSM 44229]
MIGVDDFALRRRHHYATIVIDAQTGRRVAVLPGRDAATLESWLREHPGAEVVCRDGSTAYAEAIRRALPDAVQVSDRWHLWRNLCDKVVFEVRAHTGCWATANPPRPGCVHEQTTHERWNKIHDLLGQGVGLLDCSRRLGVALNTVKRYARMPEPQTLSIAPHLPPDPRRSLSRPSACPPRGRSRGPVTQLLADFRELATPAAPTSWSAT